MSSVCELGCVLVCPFSVVFDWSLCYIRNFTIRFMPIPIIDASQALKANPEKTEDALLKVCAFIVLHKSGSQNNTFWGRRLQSPLSMPTSAEIKNPPSATWPLTKRMPLNTF